MTQLIEVGIWLAALALSVWLGAWLTGRLLARIDAADRKARTARKAADDGEPSVGATPDATAAPGDGVDSERVRAVLRGGWWIGVLERLAVTGCILVGFTPDIPPKNDDPGANCTTPDTSSPMSNKCSNPLDTTAATNTSTASRQLPRCRSISAPRLAIHSMLKNR